MERVGVFVCHCGTNIKATIDIDAVVAHAQGIPGVAFAAQYTYLCAEAGQKIVQQAIIEHQLSGIVVCACSPRMHRATFRNAAANAELNPYMVEIANLREQCSWVHKDINLATEKAFVLLRAAVAKVHNNAPLFPGTNPVTKRALIVGGGIAGIQAALDIAEAGFMVDLIEETPSIGGKMAQLDKTFPTLDCAACILTPKMVEAATHKNINLHTYSTVESVEGFVGNFTATIRKHSRSVNIKTCTGCGNCMAKCPVKKIPSEFDCGLKNRTAIYTPFAQAVPNVPVIDRSHCLKFKNGKCGLCQTVCAPGAIDFTLEDEIITQTYGVIIAATGFEPINLSEFGEYAYQNSRDVITSLELERILNAAGPTGGKLTRPSDGRQPQSITFIQCVGSRDTSARGKTYCSKICCMYTAKHAIAIKEKYPHININVFYIDVRTPGKNFDEFYRRAVEVYGTNYIKGQVGKVMDTGKNLQVQAVDLLENTPLEYETDLVVLATAIRPHNSAKSLSKMLAAGVDANNFFSEAHPKLRPVESATAGIFVAGACNGPKDIPETVAQASAAACKAIGVLVKNSLSTNPCTAISDINLCNGCAACVSVCPYWAISTLKGPSEVNQALCQGCGACVSACPSGAMDLNGFSNKQIMAEVDALCL